MSETEHRITVNRNPADAAPKTGRFGAAKEESEETAKRVRARRAEIHEQHRMESARGPDPDVAANAPAPEPREDLASIEFTALGRTIVYGPPQGVSLIDRIARLYTGRDPSMAEFRLTRILMGVRSIDGEPVQPLTDEISRTALANRLGDDLIDLLMYYDGKHWPPLTVAELPVVKKKSRT